MLSTAQETGRVIPCQSFGGEQVVHVVTVRGYDWLQSVCEANEANYFCGSSQWERGNGGGIYDGIYEFDILSFSPS